MQTRKTTWIRTGWIGVSTVSWCETCMLGTDHVSCRMLPNSEIINMLKDGAGFRFHSKANGNAKKDWVSDGSSD